MTAIFFWDGRKGLGIFSSDVILDINEPSCIILVFSIWLEQLMSAEEIERKVAVIFATDVVSYSKHVEIDESNTLKNLRSCEKILMELFP